jgi:hypothetical protein
VSRNQHDPWPAFLVPHGFHVPERHRAGVDVERAGVDLLGERGKFGEDLARTHRTRPLLAHLIERYAPRTTGGDHFARAEVPGHLDGHPARVARGAENEDVLARLEPDALP